MVESSTIVEWSKLRSDIQMVVQVTVQYQKGIWIADNHCNTGHSNGGYQLVCNLNHSVIRIHTLNPLIWLHSHWKSGWCPLTVTEIQKFLILFYSSLVLYYSCLGLRKVQFLMPAHATQYAPRAIRFYIDSYLLQAGYQTCAPLTMIRGTIWHVWRHQK